MVSEPFTGLFSNALKDLCASIDPKDFVLFMFLCAHANEHGVCFPGVKKISQALDMRFEEVRYRLDHLERQSLLRYLRRGARNPYTGEFVSDLYQMNPRILLTKSPVTHAAENVEPAPVTHSAENAEPDQFRMPPSNVQHNQNHNQIHQPEELTRINNQHHQPDEFPSEGEKAGTGGASYAWQDERQMPQTNAQTQDSTQPAPAGTKPAPAGHAKGNTPPSSAPPPNWEAAKRYTNALADARLEALANELKAVAAPTRLYNAREMVMTYGEVEVRKALTQLAAAKAKGNVYNPMGLLTSWLRNGAVKGESTSAAPEDENLKYISGPYASIINH